MPELFCPFRLDVRGEGDSEVATCAYIQQVTGSRDVAVAQVHRSACEACCAAFPSVAAKLNPVMPSLLYSACELMSSGDTPVNDAIRRLHEWSEKAVMTHPGVYRQRAIHGCDVVLYADVANPQTDAAVASVLEQQRIELRLHLIDATCQAGMEKYRDHPRVVIHKDDQQTGLLNNLHQLAPTLTGQFIAVQTTQAKSRPDRLAVAVGALDDVGGEFFVSAAQTPAGVVESDPKSRSLVVFDSLVMRRSSFIDMNGIAEDSDDPAGELLGRAIEQKRNVVQYSQPTVDFNRECRLIQTTSKPGSSPRGFDVSNHGDYACDVVLPFRGHAAMAEEALKSVVDQDGATTVVHLIDDGSPEDVTDFLMRWHGHSNVRVYRNSKNIGQFASFNNVVEHLETDFVAVQDGDDISRPNRIRESCRHMLLTKCDLFAAATQMFGPAELVQETAKEQLSDGTWVRRSKYPSARRASYFLENPTLVVNVNAFRQLGGFADFGIGPRNRTGLDTEFMNRAYLSGSRIGVSRQVLVDYRCHGSSATQNSVTGFGSVTRRESADENNRRLRLMMAGPFDARDFGSLGRYEGVTVRL